MKGLVTSSVTLENKKKVRSLSVTNQNTKEKLYCGYGSSDDLFRSVIKKPDCMVCDSDSFSSSDAEEDNNLQNLYQDDLPSQPNLKLAGDNLKNLDFLIKFLNQFPKLGNLDLGENKFADEEVRKMKGILDQNQFI